MPFEALAWTFIVILGPSLAAALKPRLGNFEPIWIEIAGWIHAAALPFLALILGSISARAAGITHFDPVTWSPGLLAAMLGFLAAVLARSVLPNPPVGLQHPAGRRPFRTALGALPRRSCALDRRLFALSGCGLGVGNARMGTKPAAVGKKLRRPPGLVAIAPAGLFQLRVLGDPQPVDHHQPAAWIGAAVPRSRTINNGTTG